MARPRTSTGATPRGMHAYTRTAAIGVAVTLAACCCTVADAAVAVECVDNGQSFLLRSKPDSSKDARSIVKAFKAVQEGCRTWSKEKAGIVGQVHCADYES